MHRDGVGMDASSSCLVFRLIFGLEPVLKTLLGFAVQRGVSSLGMSGPSSRLYHIPQPLQEESIFCAFLPHCFCVICCIPKRTKIQKFSVQLKISAFVYIINHHAMKIFLGGGGLRHSCTSLVTSILEGSQFHASVALRPGNKPPHTLCIEGYLNIAV
jgi:hypothetical protein